MFVLDVADDLLEYILDGHQARHAAVFVDDDGHVAVVGAELAQQHVEALGLRHEGGGTQQVLDVEGVLVVLQDQRQQVLGQQHADHLVEALADHRIARVRGGDDGGEEFLRRLVGPDAHHLRARHHDVADLQVGDLDGAFDDGQRLVVEQFVLMGTAQHVQQFVAVLGFVGKSLGDLPKPGLLPVDRSIFTHVFDSKVLWLPLRASVRRTGRDDPVRPAAGVRELPSRRPRHHRCGHSPAGAGSRG